MADCAELTVALVALQDPPEVGITFPDFVPPEMAVTICIEEVFVPDVLAVPVRDENGTDTFLLTNEAGNVAVRDENGTLTELLVVNDQIPVRDESNVLTHLILVPVP